MPGGATSPLTAVERSFKMLNMSSVGAEDAPVSALEADEDRTTRARIRDAAIVGFAADGVRGTTVRAIAATAGVSPGLVLHHFGSKDGLRIACDAHVADEIRRRKGEALGAGPGPALLGGLGDDDGLPLLDYLASTLTDGSAHVAELIDELVADAEASLALAVETGVARPSDHPRERAAVLTLWSLGALVLREHVTRVLGGELDQPGPYLTGAVEVLSGLLTDDAASALRHTEEVDG